MSEFMVKRELSEASRDLKGWNPLGLIVEGEQSANSAIKDHGKKRGQKDGGQGKAKAAFGKIAGIGGIWFHWVRGLGFLDSGQIRFDGFPCFPALPFSLRVQCVGKASKSVRAGKPIKRADLVSVGNRRLRNVNH